MSFLLNLVPFWYRWAAIGVLVAAVWGHGYFKGSEAGQEKVEAITAQIQLERDQQALHSAQKIIQDKEVLSETVSDFHSNIAALNAYWLRQPKGASLSPNPTPAKGVEARQPDPAFTGRDQCDQLKRECAVTTAMFNACRDGWLGLETR